MMNFRLLKSENKGVYQNNYLRKYECTEKKKAYKGEKSKNEINSLKKPTLFSFIGLEISPALNVQLVQFHH